MGYREYERRTLDGVKISKSAEIAVAGAIGMVHLENERNQDGRLLTKVQVLELVYEVRRVLEPVYPCSDAEFFVLLNEALRHVTTQEDIDRQNEEDRERQRVIDRIGRDYKEVKDA